MLRFEWQIDRVEPWNRKLLVSLSCRLFAIKKISDSAVLSCVLIFRQNLRQFNSADLEIVLSLT